MIRSLSIKGYAARRLFYKRGNGPHWSWHRQSSSVDPSMFVGRTTTEDLEKNPELDAFFRANFPDQFGVEIETVEDVLPSQDELREFGFTDDDLKFMEMTEGKARKKTRDLYQTDRHMITRKLDRGLGTPEQQALNIRVIRSYKRTVQGSRESRRLRKRNLIPGLLQGSDPSNADCRLKIMLQTPWSELARETTRQRHAFESRVYDLTVYEDEEATEGETYRVIAQNVRWFPVKQMLVSANFCTYTPGKPIKIPIVEINTEESPALRRDGFIVPVNRSVECVIADGVPIPMALELECTGIQLKDVIRLDRVDFPDGVKISKNVDPEKFVIGPVHGGRGGGTDEDEESVDE